MRRLAHRSKTTIKLSTDYNPGVSPGASRHSNIKVIARFRPIIEIEKVNYT